jgi:peptide/nickel transport system ATP-binding protein
VRPRLIVRGLAVRYRRDNREVTALSGIDLEIGKGEKLAVIGESGSGKSTLALSIAALLSRTAEVTGSVEWPALGRTPVNGGDIGFIFQDPSASLDPVLTIGEQIAEVALTHRAMNWRQAFAFAEELLDRVRLPEPKSMLRAFPHQLSGGQKQRVAIAAAIAGKPGLLIADEATSALDTIAQAEVVALIQRLVDEEGMSLLFISHDIALASEIANRIAVLRDGKLVEIGETRNLLASPSQPYTRTLLNAHLGLDTRPLWQALGSDASARSA